ncbi:hypothetical protein GGR56DRAFT_692217 [Xylariaceae sp. FL0804]|nr:hypothetical protein GGR56DRAFT_692217 [Xylariaceae sp. FL0804]
MPQSPLDKPAAEAPPSSGGGIPADAGEDGDPFAALRDFQTVIIVDDSDRVKPYWDDVGAFLRQIGPICCECDSNGIDIQFVNHPKRCHFLTGEREYSSEFKHLYIGIADGDPRIRDNVAGIFARARPGGHDTFGWALSQVLDPCMDLYERRYHYLLRQEQEMEEQQREQQHERVRQHNGNGEDNHHQHGQHSQHSRRPHRHLRRYILPPLNVIVVTSGVPPCPAHQERYSPGSEPRIPGADRELDPLLRRTAARLDAVRAPRSQVRVLLLHVGDVRGLPLRPGTGDDWPGRTRTRDIVDTATWPGPEQSSSSSSRWEGVFDLGPGLGLIFGDYAGWRAETRGGGVS